MQQRIKIFFILILILSPFIYSQKKTKIKKTINNINNQTTYNIPQNMVVIENAYFKYRMKYTDVEVYEQIKPFAIGKYEVTQAEWVKLMGYNNSEYQGANLPIINVTWFEAQEFIEKLNDSTGLKFRLPTNKEWIFCATEGYKINPNKWKNYYNDLGWHEYNSDRKLKPIGLKSPNSFGLYDMCGNAFEWCYALDDDYFKNGYCQELPELFPFILDSKMYQMQGGGSYEFSSGLFFNVSSRLSKDNVLANGFRLVLELSDSKKKEIIHNKNDKSFKFRPETVVVPGGEFFMGNEKGYLSKVHRVKLDTFVICKYEITRKEYFDIMYNYKVEKEQENIPIDGINWLDTQVFIKRIYEKTGELYRLPTEAEWEYAARGGKKSKGYKYAGSNNLDEVAWNDYNSRDCLKPIGTKSPNELEIFDLSGNVAEWCQDWSDKKDYIEYPYENPLGAKKGEGKIIRGGSVSKKFMNFENYRREIGSVYSSFSDSYFYVGFRLVKVINK